MMKRIFLTLVLFALPLMTMAQQAQEPQNVITVTGTAQVFASPDEAMVRLGVQEQAATAQEAQNKANAVITRFIAALTKLGIDKKDIQTSQMSLQPMYSNPKPGEAPRISGYMATDTLSVRLTDFDLVGKVIDAGTSAGVNHVENINFRLRNARGPRAEAYKDAVADARSKADAIAEALGLHITGVYDVRADAGYPMPQSYGGMMRTMDMAAATPVEPGQMEVSVSVTIRYRLG